MLKSHQLEQLEKDSQTKNLVVEGFRKKGKESFNVLAKKFTDFVNDHLFTDGYRLTPEQLTAVHRISKRAFPRMVVQFKNELDRDLCYACRKGLIAYNIAYNSNVVFSLDSHGIRKHYLGYLRKVRHTLIDEEGEFKMDANSVRVDAEPANPVISVGADSFTCQSLPPLFTSNPKIRKFQPPRLKSFMNPDTLVE